MQAKLGDTVQVHYTGRLADGTIFDTSTDGDPLEVTLGEEQVIPGFEQALIGMEPGESKTVTIPAAQAYGPYDEDKVVAVNRERTFPSHFQPQVGQQLHVRSKDGERFLVTVVEVSETTVMLDINHPLAGKDLTFDIQLVEIV